MVVVVWVTNLVVVTVDVVVVMGKLVILNMVLV